MKTVNIELGNKLSSPLNQLGLPSTHCYTRKDLRIFCLVSFTNPQTKSEPTVTNIMFRMTRLIKASLNIAGLFVTICVPSRKWTWVQVVWCYLNLHTDHSATTAGFKKPWGLLVYLHLQKDAVPWKKISENSKSMPLKDFFKNPQWIVESEIQ